MRESRFQFSGAAPLCLSKASKPFWISWPRELQWLIDAANHQRRYLEIQNITRVSTNLVGGILQELFKLPILSVPLRQNRYRVFTIVVK